MTSDRNETKRGKKVYERYIMQKIVKADVSIGGRIEQTCESKHEQLSHD